MPEKSKQGPVRVAIVGAGAVSDYHHVPALRVSTRAPNLPRCATPIPH